MTPGGKRGNPKTGFPFFPPGLEIAPRFPHSHRHDNGFILVQAIKHTPLNCHPCRRAKVLPMSPAAPSDAPTELDPLGDGVPPELGLPGAWSLRSVVSPERGLPGSVASSELGLLGAWLPRERGLSGAWPPRKFGLLRVLGHGAGRAGRAFAILGLFVN
jgi:hypothetical protein